MVQVLVNLVRVWFGSGSGLVLCHLWPVLSPVQACFFGSGWVQLWFKLHSCLVQVWFKHVRIRLRQAPGPCGATRDGFLMPLCFPAMVMEELLPVTDLGQLARTCKMCHQAIMAVLRLERLAPKEVPYDDPSMESE